MRARTAFAKKERKLQDESQTAKKEWYTTLETRKLTNSKKFDAKQGSSPEHSTQHKRDR